MTTGTAETRTKSADYDEIVRILQAYGEGFGAGDISRFEVLFHEDAWIFYTQPDGTLVKGPIRGCFEDWAGGATKAVARIISVTQAGDVANALLAWESEDNPSDRYIDAHNLIWINGAWKITNKTATHTSRAGGV